MQDKTGLIEVRVAAMDLLARREHSQRELRTKLERRFPPEQVDETLQTLAAEGLQSDSRFAEAYVRQRSQRGYGVFFGGHRASPPCARQLVAHVSCDPTRHHPPEE